VVTSRCTSAPLPLHQL
jgi:triosephosphate isomerase